MLKPIIASLFLAASATAAFSQNATTAPAAGNGQWTLASGSDACMIHASSGTGTVLSLTGMAGEEALLFVIQNDRFGSLSDGQQVGIELEFDDFGEWKIPALAQRNLDSDGPGLVFAIRPGRSDGANFLKEFASASGMRIAQAEGPLDSLTFAGGEAAISSLATCLSEKWAGASGAGPYQGQGGPLEEIGEEEEEEEAIPL